MVLYRTDEYIFKLSNGHWAHLQHCPGWAAYGSHSHQNTATNLLAYQLTLGLRASQYAPNLPSGPCSLHPQPLEPLTRSLPCLLSTLKAGPFVSSSQRNWGNVDSLIVPWPGHLIAISLSEPPGYCLKKLHSSRREYPLFDGRGMDICLSQNSGLNIQDCFLGSRHQSGAKVLLVLDLSPNWKADC